MANLLLSVMGAPSPSSNGPLIRGTTAGRHRPSQTTRRLRGRKKSLPSEQIDRLRQRAAVNLGGSYQRDFSFLCTSAPEPKGEGSGSQGNAMN